MTNNAGSSEAVLLLKRAAAAINSAENTFFDARNPHTDGVVRKLYCDNNLPVPVTQSRYYSWNDSGVGCVRVESSCDALELKLKSLFIKNREGIWDVMPECAAEVSAIFSPDQLLGTFPFFRFFSSLQHPYELSVGERGGDNDHVVVKGRLEAKPVDTREDIAREFSYTLEKGSAHMAALEEKTFFGRCVHLEFDKWVINAPVDPGLFEVPTKSRLIMSSMSQYTDLRQQRYANEILRG